MVLGTCLLPQRVGDLWVVPGVFQAALLKVK